MAVEQVYGTPVLNEKKGPLGGPRWDREPLVLNGRTFHQITEDVCAPLERMPSLPWIIAFGFALLGAAIFGSVIVSGTLFTGMGMHGVNHPTGWGVHIVNFVFWIGIGHAGTLISAVLFLFRQKWRTGVNRSAEAMTIFAVMTAGVFPAVHVGRAWFVYWMLPYPNHRYLWPNFNSPLVWDIFAISTYATISIFFWYMGLIPDFATVRDRAIHPLRKKVYGLLSFGWNGSNRAWRHWEIACLILSGLATPLVLSVHTIVSFDFATSIVPGWHATIFPPYFVVGAIFSGFGMTLTLLVPLRSWFKLEDYITMNHLEATNKILLATGMIVGFAYSTEFFMAAYSGSHWEGFIFRNRAFGTYWWAYWIMFSCNAFVPQIFWFKKMRRSIPVMFVVSLLVNVGMWFERYVIIVTSLTQDFLPQNWGLYVMSPFDWGLTIGSFGWFFTFFLVFCRTFPTVAIAEVKSVSDPDDGAGVAAQHPQGAH
jgi:molybdopterin-containing oxidoreductase family membrane subunit